QAHWAAADLAEPNVAGKLFQQANELLGGVDILVNNTSGPSPTPPSQISTPTWQSEFEKMVLPVFELTRLAVAPMRERGWGRIITITSSGVVQPIPNLGISNALRSSLTAWLKTLASEVAREGVTVNVVAPGRIETDRTRQIDAAAAQRLG
ncbi:SDR family NAD(P)-dependent oxidoreductase, partial [Mesorhizobium sp. M7D.F.Ca.US.004.03.1.1]|uniref:SDR family NAD(P)-dependent oxidoreductase n=1 Tax=Mesorhizobium sp. M7D.F.Ca.US.004.03.1.1 TaxID=2496702 RepID=UPI000FCA606D